MNNLKNILRWLPLHLWVKNKLKKVDTYTHKRIVREKGKKL